MVAGSAGAPALLPLKMSSLNPDVHSQIGTTPAPVLALSLPRAAVLSDQQGDYIFVIGAENKVEQRRIKLGQSTPATAVVVNGLAEGEQVIVEGVQRVRPGIAVNPGPIAPGPSATPAPAAAR